MLARVAGYALLHITCRATYLFACCLPAAALCLVLHVKLVTSHRCTDVDDVLLSRLGSADVSKMAASTKPVNIVLICGFESFNVSLYVKAAKRISKTAPWIHLKVRSTAVVRYVGCHRKAICSGSKVTGYAACRGNRTPAFTMSTLRHTIGSKHTISW